MSNTGPAGQSRRELARTAVDRGLDAVTAVKDTASEALRVRRDPARVAMRRVRAAKRRLSAWSMAGLALIGVGVIPVSDIAAGEVAVTSVGAVALVGGFLVYCVTGSVTAARDLRQRSRIARQLPPPQPDRRAVTASLRPMIAQLSGYSDALRASVQMIGMTSYGAGGDAIRELRNETLTAADAAETSIRAKAAEMTALVRATGHASTPEIAAACTRLTSEIERGVANYGALVAAASDAAVASGDLAASAPLAAADDLPVVTQRLTALAAGMREVTVAPHVAARGIPPPDDVLPASTA